MSAKRDNCFHTGFAFARKTLERIFKDANLLEIGNPISKTEYAGITIWPGGIRV